MTMRALSSRAGLLLALGVALPACSATSGEPTDKHEDALTGPQTTFIVLYKSPHVPRNAAQVIESAGGEVVATYQGIGVVIAHAGTQGFVTTVGSDPHVEGVAPTTGAGVSGLPVKFPHHKLPKPHPTPSGTEPLGGMQWNMDQIHAGEAREITPGRRSVVVGVMDSGVDDRVEDLQGQVDHARSVSCVGGVANTDPSTWMTDDIGHGTHVAGIIGAKQDGVGVVGVAPGSTLAAVQVTNLSTGGLVYPETFICGMHWAATHGFDLVNASIFLDPWYYTCPSDPTQRTILKAAQRAVSFAAARGVTVVVAASNEDQDLANPTVDPFSPTDTGAPVTREITNDCKLLPVELNGVVAVSAVGFDRKLAYYSNYGLGVIDVTAPGGDLHVPAPGNESGQIVSDIPSYSFFYQIANSYNGRIGIGCTDGLDPNDPNADPSTCAETYALLQGTSMSAPHATGVAALAMSRFGHMSTGELMARLDHSATPLACPPNPYQPYPADMPPLTCETGHHFETGFYGHGEVDALAAVRRWW